MAGCLAVCVFLFGSLVGAAVFFGSPLAAVGVWFVTLILTALLASAGEVTTLRREVRASAAAQRRLIAEVRWAGLTDAQKTEALEARKQADLRAQRARELHAAEWRRTIRILSKVAVALVGVALIGALALAVLRKEGALDVAARRPATPPDLPVLTP